MENSVIVGLTGQTGAGKSTVCLELAAEGCAIIDCDVLAHKVVEQSEPCKEALAQNFGQDILDEKGHLDRKLLGSRAFRTKEETALLNQITHPYIQKALRKEIQDRRAEKRKFIVLDAPTLLESGCDNLCDFIIVVTAPKDIRKQRIIDRDHLTEAEADKRIAAQQPEEFYTHPADFVIDGTMMQGTLSRKVRTILRSIEGGCHD
ncbi:MAG: dephospho-CoA kinase [Oscillospiraceae bacterium]|nr:dephospho-CoA kinase [Oscillospiraceae bacterium]